MKFYFPRLVCFPLSFVLALIISQQNCVAQAEFGAPKLMDDWRNGFTPQLSVTTADANKTTLLSLTSSERWSKIVFQSLRDGNWEIYIASGSGEQPVRLTANPFPDTYPRLNRGATAIAFVANPGKNTDIYRINSNGGDLVRLTNHTKIDTMPTWSPDGSQILFVSERDGNAELYLMNADGSVQRRLTNHAASDTFPAWSPDGSQIVWARTTATGGSLWVMGSDGSNARALVPEQPYTIIQHPVWSPDGQQIAYDSTGNIRQGLYWSRIYVLRLGDAEPQSLAGKDLHDFWVSSWSMDGKQLAYSHLVYEYRRPQYVLTEIQSEKLLVNQPDKQIGRLPFSVGVDMAPQWQTADIWSPAVDIQPLPMSALVGRLVVTWRGIDTGIAGIMDYHLQYRYDGTSDWQDWLLHTARQSALFGGEPGKTVFLRVQARDAAGNTSDWSGDNAATTTFYTADLTGRITDQRDQLLSRATIQLTPNPLSSVSVDPSGIFQARLLQSGPHAIQVNSSGFRPNTFACCAASSNPVQLYLSTDASLIQNGSFEESLTGWQRVEGSVAYITNTAQIVGNYSLLLGAPCPLPCLSRAEPLPMPYEVNDMWIDNADNIHILHLGFDQKVFIQHRVRTNRGEWLPPTPITGPLTGNLDGQPRIKGDNHDNLYAIWSVYPDIFFVTRQPNSLWSQPQIVATGQDADFAVDPQGNVHLVFKFYLDRKTQLYYRQRLADGSWQEPVQLSEAGDSFFGDASTIEDPVITVEGDGIVHILWERVTPGIGGHTQIFHTFGFPNIGFSELEQVVDRPGLVAKPIAAVVDQNANLHLLWHEWRPTYYMRRSGTGQWSEPVVMPRVYHSGKFILEHNNRLHLITMLEREFQNGQYVGGYLYWTKAAEQPEWPSPLPVFTESKENETFAVDRSGHLHFIGRNLFENAANPEQPEFYQTTPGITQQTSHHAIHQTVTIPADMHQPTLAFLYQLQGSAKGTSSLRMYVTAPLTGSVPVSASHTLSSTNNLTSTIVFSTSQSVGWTHAWADLGSWAGQQITITFEITQAADDTYIRALLDEITLTPWLTPAPKQLTPAHLEAGVGATLVISGANFVATPVVELNNTLLTDVQWFNATTLQASVPSALDPGIYDLWVTNPSGQSSVRPGALAIGKQVYLPFIGR